MATPMPASTQNTVRQVPTRSTCPPITGARIGASPLIAAIAEKYAAATFPANMSATTARPTTMPAAPAAPCTRRITMSTVMEVVTAQTTDAATNTATPISSGRRRPNRSDAGPVISWPTPRPTMQADRVELGGAGRRRQVAGQLRQRGEVHVQAQRTEGGQRAERDDQPRPARSNDRAHSHSMVPGGLLVTSSTTRFTSGTSPVIRLEIRASRS